MKLLNGIVWALVIVIVWAFAMAGYRHFQEQGEAVPQVAEAPTAEVTDYEEDEFVTSPEGREEAEIWISDDPQDEWERSQETTSRFGDEERARNEQVEEYRRLAEEQEQERERERQERREQMRRDALSTSFDGPGVDRAALNYYRTEVTEQAAWGEFQSCVGRFSARAREYIGEQMTFDRSYQVSVTKDESYGVDTGFRGAGGNVIGRIETRGVTREYDLTMSCEEILRRGTMYDQHRICGRARDRMSALEAEMRDIQRECTRPGTRAGLAPGNVRDILRLPR